MLMREDARAATLNPLAPKAPDMPEKAKAKSVIFLFMAGGPSHIETFDPKPLLNQLSGARKGRVGCAHCIQRRSLDFRNGTFRPTENGIEVSDLLPHVGGASTISPLSAPATATWWCIPPRSISFSQAESFQVFRAWVRG